MNPYYEPLGLELGRAINVCIQRSLEKVHIGIHKYESRSEGVY